MKKTRLLALLTAATMLMGTASSLAEESGHPDTWFSEETVTISIMRDENPSQTIDPNSLKVQTVKEILNIQLDVQTPPKDSYADKKAVLIRTDDMPDIMLLDTSDVRNYARDDMFINLSDYRDKLPHLFALLDSNPSYAMLTVDGSYYSAPTIFRASPHDGALSGQFPVIRMDLLEKNNLAVPTTFDELYETLKALKELYPDCIPLTNRKGGSTTSTRKLLDTMAYPLGSGSTMYYDEDLGGKWVYGPANENFKAVLTYLNKLYSEGLLDPDYASNTVDQWKEKMSSGKALMYFDNSGFASQFQAALNTEDPDAKLSVIPTLTNTIGQTRNYRYDLDHTSQQWVIASSTENLDACLAYLDWCYTDQGADINGYGKEGVTFEYDENGKPYIKEEILAEIAATGSSTAFYDLQAKYGLGLLDISPYNDTGAQTQMEMYMMDEETRANYEASKEMINNDAGLRVAPLEPSLTAEQTERYKELKTKVEDMVYQEIDKYITGEEPIENYDKVIEAARAAGAEEMEQIYNDAWNAALGN